MLARGFVIATFALAMNAKPAFAGDAAGALRFELDYRSHSALARAQMRQFRNALDCKVVSIKPSKREFVRKAIAHANQVLRDPAFVAMLGRKRDWVRSADTGATIAGKLTRGTLTVYVATFRRSRAHPCNTKLADGHTNAFAPGLRPGKPSQTQLLFLAERYVLAQFYAPDPQKGMRNLARTLIHEALHVLGYSHAGEEPFTRGYNNTVPVYVSCLVMNWGKTSWAAANCHKASARRRPRSVYRWLCYDSQSLGDYVGRLVRVSRDPDVTRMLGRSTRAQLVRVHDDNTVTIRWPAGGKRERVDKCRLML